MKKNNKTDLENEKTDLTEEELLQNIEKSNQDTTLSVLVGNKKTKKHKKITYISIAFGFVLVLIGTLLLFTKDNIKYDENFTITSIKPKTTGSYITNNETFVIETSSANVDMVREHLYVEPAVNYEIKKINNNEFEVSLSNVESDTLVNLSLVKDKIKSYSWAFQTTKELKVLSIYPANGSSTVSTNSGISVVLSYPNVEHFENYFEISPHVEGTFTQNGRVWKFVPNKELDNNTTYTITINKGLSVGDYVLEESVKSTFSTYNRPQNSTTTNTNNRYYKHSSISVDHINTFTIKEPISFKMYNDYNISKIKLYKLNSFDDFIKFLNNESDYNYTDLGQQDFTYKEKYYTYVLNHLMDEGYYIEEAYLSSGEVFTTIPVQVNKLSAFLYAGDEDLVIWTGSENELLKDVKVTYNDKEYKTDQNGLLKIRHFNDESTKLKYVKIGDKNPLIIGVNNYKLYNYPDGYIYTDKPIYKNNDTINIWGYVPLNFYQEMYDDFKKQDFVLSLENETIPIEINNDGTFTTKYTLDNLKDGYISINLTYKNVGIAYRYVNVSNYKKQNYEYETIMEKNYVDAGNDFEFIVHVNHVTGISVQNKNITATFNNKTYTSTTDVNGNAHFRIPTTKEDTNSLVSWKYINIKTGDADYNENDFTVAFIVFNHSVNVTESNYDSKTLTDSLTIRNIDSKKNNGNVNYYNIDKLFDDGPYNGVVNVKLYENKSVKKLYNTYYNEFTQKKENVYTYEQVSNEAVINENINASFGNLEFKINYNLKENTENERYYYTLEYKIIKGNETYIYKTYVYNYNSFEYQKKGKFSESILNTGYYENDDYNYYRYFLNTDENKYKYSKGDDINFNLESFDGSSIPDSKVLRISFKNKVLDSKIFNSNEELDDIFEKGSIPGVGYVGALFTNGRFYRLPSYYFDYNEEDSKLNIEITNDKESYSPGDKVKVNIKVKNKDNLGVKSRVIVSVVDKAVFNVVSDTTNILENIYSNISYHAYTFSSFRDYELGDFGGGRGDTGGDSTRIRFSDTIYFKELETDSNGEVEVEFELNDSVTTFVTTVHAVNNEAYVGVNKNEIVSTLPLAISVVEPNGLKTSDDTVISANSIGSVKDDVKYTFELVGLDKKIEVTGKVGSTVYANFGKLESNDYKVKITATSEGYNDSIQFPFTVKESFQEISIKAISSIKDGKSITPLKSPIILEFYKDGFSNYKRYLEILTDTFEDRLDTKIAYYKGLEYENKYYDYNYPINITDMDKFKSNGLLKYLENDTPSYLLTAIVNYFYKDLYKLDKNDYYKKLYEANNNDEIINNLLVLSSFKEPILDELKELNKHNSVYFEDRGLKVALAFIFEGDYDSAKDVLNRSEKRDDYKGLLALISTFIDKENASNMIDEVYNSNNADRFVYFAMLSYFINNETDLSKTSTINISYKDNKEQIKLSGLTMKKVTINNSDLDTLKISSTDETDMVNYYYEGGISEISEDNIFKNINISFNTNTLYVGQTYNLRLDLSKLDNISGNLKIFLPNSLRLTGSSSLGQGVYVSANRGEYIVLSISKEHEKNVNIPVYVTYPGNYKIEESILKYNDNYYVSNSLDVNIK